MRARLYDQLHVKHQRSAASSSQENQMHFKLAVSIIVDFLQRHDMPYSVSVFLPEAGFSHESHSKAEIEEAFGIRTEQNETPFLLELISRL